MTTPNTGAAREVAPGRLKDFEDSADLDTSPSMSLPPRRHRPPKQATTPPPETAQPAPDATSEELPAPAATPPELSPEDPTEPAPPVANATAAPTPDVSTTQEAPTTRSTRAGSKGPEDRVRPSNVHIPVALLKPLEEKCRAESLSHGEVIIMSIERVYDRLPELIHPPATVGGGVFTAQRSRGARQSDGPLTPLNYRLRERDFATLDTIVEQFEASSRGHVITAALKDLFSDQLD